MNKRQNKKKIKYIIDNIQIVNLKENEFLLFRYDQIKYRPQYIAELAEIISKNITGKIVTGKIVFIPNDLEMKKVSE